MKLVTSTNIYFERTDGSRIPCTESIERCARAGYRHLDLGLQELALTSELFNGPDWHDEILRIRHLARSLGATFVQAHATIFDFCNTPSDSPQEKMFFRSLEVAELLGIQNLVVHPSTKLAGSMADPVTMDENVAFFQKISNQIASAGFTIAVENMWGNARQGVKRFAIQPDELRTLMQRVDRNNVKICWDVGHGYLENIDQHNAVMMLKEWIVTTHLSDTTGPDNIHRLPYTGNIDWDAFLHSLATIGYLGPISFELQHYLRSMPEALVDVALKLSFETGAHLARELANKSTVRAENPTSTSASRTEV